MLRSALLTLTMCVIALTGFAQTPIIKGVIIDKTDMKPLPGATVSLLLQKDSTLIQKNVTDASGIFEFRPSAPDSFIVTVDLINYQQYVSFFSLDAASPAKELGMLSLDRQGKDLSAVTIVSKAAAVTQKGDTTQFSASQYKVNPDATVEDLVKKMPGITVAKDGTVTAQGEQVKKVTIDGKDFFGDDATAALKNLPSSVVDKIQVFDRLSDQAQLTGFDDGNSVKAINVVTKSGLKNGQFGRIYAGAGTEGTYAAGGNVSFFNGDRRISLVGNFNNVNQQNFGSQDLLGVTGSGGGRSGGGRGGRGGGGFGGESFSVGQTNGISTTNAPGINFSDQWGKKVKVSGSYFYNNGKTENENYSNTQTFSSPKDQFAIQNSSSTTNNTNHRVNFRLEYTIDKKNSLFVIPSFSYQKNNYYSTNSLQSFYGTNDSIYTYDGLNTNDRNGFNFGNNIMFRHAFDKKGRSYSVGFRTTFSTNDGESITNGLYRYLNVTPATDSIQNQFGDSKSNTNNYQLDLAYTEPIGKKGQLEFRYSPSIQKSSSDKETYSFDTGDGKYTQFESTLSNKFDNTITKNNGGVSYRLMKDRDNMFSVGLNLENTKLESDRIFPVVANVNQSFFNLLPNAMWRAKFGKYSNIRLFYRGYTNTPSVTQLQDVVDPSNPLRVTSGNPFLKQATGSFIGTRYSYTNTKSNNSFFANLFYQAVNDYVSNATYIASADSILQNGTKLAEGSQLSKPVNLDGYKSFRTYLTYSMPLTFIKTTLNLSAGFNYNRLPGLINDLETTTDNNTYSGGVVLASNISEFVDYNISYNVNYNKSNTTGGSISNSSYTNQSIGAQLNLLSKKGWFLQNDVSNQIYTGLTAGLNQNYVLWNAGIGKKFLKNQAGELKLTVFDLLKQNQSIAREVTNLYIEDTRNKVLQQYFMLTFTYSLKNFGTAKQTNSSEGEGSGRPGGPGRPMGAGGPGF